MQNALLRIFVIPIIYLLSYLPMPVLYLKSTGFYFFVYYILKYRKKVVLENLKNSFPNKTEAEIKKISKEFYKHFCDVIFETIKNVSISEKELMKRCPFTETGKKIFNDFAEKKQSVVVVIGHCGNWEWSALSYQIHFKQILVGAYHPLSNKVFDSFVLKLRSKFGATIVSMKEFYPYLLNNRNENCTIGLIADQSPPKEGATWVNFLNRETAFFSGPEKIAAKFNYPVVYVHVTKIKRGYYECDVKKVVDSGQEFKQGEITQKHVKLLEENIIQQPAYWLWSHKRWKHKF